MSITPSELREVTFDRVRRGYDTAAVDRAMHNVAAGIEQLLHERNELAERLRQLEVEVERYREIEATLSQTLQLADRAAEELKAEARAEADRILAEARTQVAGTPHAAAPTSSLPDPAFIELLGETRAIRSLLQALLTSPPERGSGAPFAPRPQ